jgi:hypothetical protein
MALEERTGAAETSVPKKKKKWTYEERRIAVFLSELELMRVCVGEPELLYRNRWVSGTTYSHWQAVLRLAHDWFTRRHAYMLPDSASPSSP